MPVKTPAVVRHPRHSASLTIAFADDIPEIQALAREWLTAAGHRVMCAADGGELTRLSHDHHFDVVITDVMMPERDGLEVISALKKSQPGVRIIAISGGGTVLPATDCLRDAKRLGADAVLAKPFNRSQFMQAVEHVIA